MQKQKYQTHLLVAPLLLGMNYSTHFFHYLTQMVLNIVYKLVLQLH